MHKGNLKIFFASTPWANSQSISKDYRMQTPGRSGIWNSIEVTEDIRQADYLLIQDYCEDFELLRQFPRNKILYVSREATINYMRKCDTKSFIKFSFWDNSGYLPVRWAYGSEGISTTSKAVYTGIEFDYDHLKNLKAPTKSLEICTVLSNKSDTKGHKIRKKFVANYLKKHSIDVFGSVNYANKQFKEGSKFSTLLDYKYCLAFDNQDNLTNFVGTQFTDAILAWSVPIFWGGAHLAKYYPSDSFFQFDARKKDSISIISEMISNDDYSRRLPAISEARDLILDYYNLWPTIERVLDMESD